MIAAFLNISKIRKEPAFIDGDVYFPLHDENIFSFMRKADYDPIAYLVVVYVTNSPPSSQSVPRMMDFTTIMPNFPAKGILTATSHHHSGSSEHEIG